MPLISHEQRPLKRSERRQQAKQLRKHRKLYKLAPEIPTSTLQGSPSQFLPFGDIATRHDVCSKWMSSDLVPTNSPLDRKLMTEVAPTALVVLEAPYHSKAGRRGGVARKASWIGDQKVGWITIFAVTLSASLHCEEILGTPCACF